MRNSSPKIDALLKQLNVVENSLRDLQSQRASLQLMLKEERPRWKLERPTRLIELGRKAVMQRDGGMTLADIARANQCGQTYVLRAIETWRQSEGITRTRTALNQRGTSENIRTR